MDNNDDGNDGDVDDYRFYEDTPEDEDEWKAEFSHIREEKEKIYASLDDSSRANVSAGWRDTVQSSKGGEARRSGAGDDLASNKWMNKQLDDPEAALTWDKLFGNEVKFITNDDKFVQILV